MKVLLVGSGGREHAVAWKLLQSPKLTQLYMTAPHAGVEVLQSQSTIPVTRVDSQDPHHTDLVRFASKESIDFVLITSEIPLEAGLGDRLQSAGIKVFAPSRAAAQIESSKAFAKAFMQRHAIPTARYTIATCFSEGKACLDRLKVPVVIKASGLAAGKGVFLPNSHNEAEKILRELLEEKRLGLAGSTVVIEERLYGPEISVLCFTDGHSLRLMPLARDYKRLLDGDLGPNTGGMGAYAPVDLPNFFSLSELVQTILQPTIEGLQQEERTFVGILYAGILLTQQGPRVLEFNSRLGDPEAQVLMPLLETDLLDIVQACVEGKLSLYPPIKWHDACTVAVVLSEKPYPQPSAGGHVISGLLGQEQALFCFHAGTRYEGDRLITAGGRVLTLVAKSREMRKAIELAYNRVQNIHFLRKQYRRDIGPVVFSFIDHYEAAGVSLSASQSAISLMTSAVKSTYGPEVLAGIGAFGGLFSASFLKRMQEPVLVASTDGVGTKVDLALMTGRLEGLGFDIVHHCVNDILVQGARPLFFLDYIACDRLDPSQVVAVVTSIAEACKALGCALLGGETAEMPGIYASTKMDVAGTLVGVVERDRILPQDNLCPGDLLLGITSSGPHTNGYSLLRKLCNGLPLNNPISGSNTPLIEALLAPHRCYWPLLAPVLSYPKKLIKALAHITGGGLLDNIPRVLPPGVQAQLIRGSWPISPLFQWVQQYASIPFEQMYRVFNMGLGMIIVTDPSDKDLLQSLVDEPLWQVGHLIASNSVGHNPVVSFV